MFDSFERVKIKYPTSEIYTSGGLFGTDDMLNPEAKDVEKCHPAKYCMTVEQFLKAGHRFVEGDFVHNHYGAVAIDSENIREWNHQAITKCDRSQYILRAAALEEKPKRVKVEYVKLENPSIHELAELYDSGELVFYQGGEYLKVTQTRQVYFHAHNLSIYRRIETPIEWWEDLVDYIGKATEDSGFAEPIKDEKLYVNASMSRDKWCDFARILLEQGKD